MRFASAVLAGANEECDSVDMTNPTSSNDLLPPVGGGGDGVEGGAGAAQSGPNPAIRVPIRPAPYRTPFLRFFELIRPMRTRIRFSLRLIHHLLALAEPASRVSTTSGGTDGGFSSVPHGGSIRDDVLGGGITQINFCPAPSGDPCDPSGPASLGTGSGANLGAGNPIHLASGNK